jgi:hypothetical protein
MGTRFMHDLFAELIEHKRGTLALVDEPSKRCDPEAPVHHRANRRRPHQARRAVVGLGHRKIWGLLTADGVAASQASVRQPQHVPVEHPAALRVGWVQRQAAAQHVHGAMIAQQTHPERNARSKPRCRNRQRPGTPLFVIGRLGALRPLCGQAYQGKKGPEPATRLVRPVETEPTGESTL